MNRLTQQERITYLKTHLSKNSQTQQDVRRLQEVNINILGPQSWNYVNQIVNLLNEAIYKLGLKYKIGTQALNFQVVVKNPSMATKFTGSLKNLFDLSQMIWKFITKQQENVYNIIEVKNTINIILNSLSSKEFPEPEMQSIKSELTTSLNNWLSILK